jgi:DNA-binding SARP family transcriptional activator
LLLINVNQVISRDSIVDQLWHERPPRTANDSLNNMTFRLRRKVGRERLETRATGYLLRLEPDQLDLLRFEQLLAQQAAEQGAARTRTLERALSLFRGLPFEDVLYAPFAQPTIRRLEELQLNAYEQLCQLNLDTGDHDSALPLLQLLVGRHPLRARLRCQLIAVLSLAGRRAEASASYHDYREALSQLGIQPDAEVEALAQQITSAPPKPKPNLTPSLGQRQAILVAAT